MRAERGGAVVAVVGSVLEEEAHSAQRTPLPVSRRFRPSAAARVPIASRARALLVSLLEVLLVRRRCTRRPRSPRRASPGRPVAELDDARREPGDEVVVVADEDDRALELQQALEQAFDRLDIEVVGRLVEDEHVVASEHHLAEEQARGLAAGEGFGRLECRVAAEEQPAEDGADLLLRRRVSKR